MKGGKNGHIGLVFESRSAEPTPKGVGLQFLRRAREHAGSTRSGCLEAASRVCRGVRFRTGWV